MGTFANNEDPDEMMQNDSKTLNDTFAKSEDLTKCCRMTLNPLTGTFANSEDPDEMPQNDSKPINGYFCK